MSDIQAHTRLTAFVLLEMTICFRKELTQEEDQKDRGTQVIKQTYFNYQGSVIHFLLINETRRSSEFGIRFLSLFRACSC
jgi:hypothetical protein